MKKRILVVDDEKDIAMVLKDIYTSRGYDVLIALTGKDALRHLEQDRLDLISLDIEMPDINGIEVLKEVKKKFPGIKTVVLSGFAEDYKDEIETIGCDALLNKPFSVNTLVETIEYVLEEKERLKADVSRLIDNPKIFANARLLFIEPNEIMYSSKLAFFHDAKRCRGEYELAAAFTGEAAVTKLEEFRPDIVLSNVNMFHLYRLDEKFAKSENQPKDVILYGLSRPPEFKGKKDVPFIGGLFDPIIAIVTPAEMDKLGRVVRMSALIHRLYVRRR